MEPIIFKLHKRKTKKHYLTDLSKPRLSDELFFIPLFGFSVCDRTRPSVKLIKDEREMKEEIAGGGGVLTEWFGQMDGQRGRPLSAPSDLTRRDRKMEGRDGRRK